MGNTNDVGGESRGGEADRMPPLAAAFLIKFDQRLGYSLVWKRAKENVKVDGSVEYKSLPSGLHNVKEDLVYFMHDNYAGISAFANGAASEAERNAQLVAVGILVPVKYGRLGKSWVYAETIKRFAQQVARDPSDLSALEDFWEKNNSPDVGPDAEVMGASQSSLTEPMTPSPLITASKGLNSASDPVASTPSSLHPSHPARSLFELLDTFGPLIFPLYRLALLRQRILLVAEAPVLASCNYVYDMSILSSIPSSLHEIVSVEASQHSARLPPLFAVGVHDIPALESMSRTHKRSGWVACTTDEVLAVKPELSDVCIKLPSKNLPQKQWPVLNVSGTNKIVKASQRDVRRYRSLRHIFRTFGRISPNIMGDSEQGGPSNQRNESVAPLLGPSTEREDFDDENEVYSEIVEPTSWRALAYSGLFWWASAGERAGSSFSSNDEEDLQDSMLQEEFLAVASPRHRRMVSSETHSEQTPNGSGHWRKLSLGIRGGDGFAASEGSPELGIVAYFHRLTSLLLEGLAESLDAALSGGEVSGSSAVSLNDTGADNASEELLLDGSRLEDEVEATLQADDLAQFGLDRWSDTDALFVQKAAKLWFGRNVEVKGMGIECCGIRIC